MNKKLLVIAELKRIQETLGWDRERAHQQADDILCQLLVDLGFEDVVKEYNEIPKWYA